ncbi:MAG: hypothetical protein ACR2NW_02330 [Thermodesulfobacteriota bacterium]
MILTKKYIVSLLIVFVFSIALTFIPLIGVLGYEYAVISALLFSFISVFISAEIINDYYSKPLSNINTSDVLIKLVLINISLLLANFLVGLVSSFFKKDCNIELGIGFYILIPLITVIFSTSIGVLTGTIFKRRGFITGSIILFLIIIYSLWALYSQQHIFFYNAIIGYFPGSVYDKNIQITSTLIIYRTVIFLWAILIFTTVLTINASRKKGLGLSHIFILIVLACLLIFSYYKQEEFGIKYSREYIKTNILPETYESAHFLIHYSPGSKAAENIELIADDHEWRYSEVSDYLDIDLEKKINSYVYPDIESRKKYFGSLHSTVANPIHQEIHQVYGTFPINELKHELVHILSSEFGTSLLKISPKMGLIEGIAVAVDWPMDTMDKHQLAKTLVINGELNGSLKDLIGFSFWYYPQSVSYTLMGSYSRYLIDNFGVENFKGYYKTGDTGVYGKDEDKLIASWIKYLNNKVELPEDAKKFSEHKFSEKSVFEDSCPRKTEKFVVEGLRDYKNNNFFGSTVNFEKANELNKNSSEIKSFLAYSYFYNKDYINLLNLDTSQGLTEVDVNIINNLKSNVLWEERGYDYAYPYIAKLSKKTLPDHIKREIDIKLDLKRFNRDIKKSFNKYLLANNEFEKIVILMGINEKYSSYSPAYYLLGRIYLKKGDYGRAIENFKTAASRTLPTLGLQLENLKLLGISQYSAGDYYGAINTFEDLAKLDPNQNYKNYAENFIERSKWALKN